MPITDLPGTFFVPTRDQIVADYKRDHSCHDPNSSTDDGTLVDIDANTTADVVMPIYHNAELAGNAAASLDDMSLTQLRALCPRLGIPDLLPATGASGFVQIAAASSGGTISAGAQLVNPLTQLTYQAVLTGLYKNGASVQIAGIDTGSQTNCDPGTVLQWVSPPPGISPNCTVLAQNDGSGLSGGAPEETQDQLVQRIEDAYADPASAGNDADIRAIAKETAGVPIEEVFTYPAIWMSGTTAVVFTVRPNTLGGSRLPNGTQIALVSTYVQSVLPGDDGIIFCTLLESDFEAHYQIDWDPSVPGWADPQPWPLYSSGDPVSVTNDTTPTALACTFDISGTTVIGAQSAPAIGNQIAFYDNLNKVYVHKTVLTVSQIGSTSKYTVTFDGTFGASDTAYVPSVGERCCPWSDSLSVIIAPTLTWVGQLGPGEQVSTFFDPGVRQHRLPLSPGNWPNKITTRQLVPIESLPQVQDALFLSPSSLPYPTPDGVQAVSSNLLMCTRILAFPK